MTPSQVSQQHSERDSAMGESMSFLPPHIFTLIGSPEVTVTQELAREPDDTPIADVAGRIIGLGKGAGRHDTEITEGTLQEPKKMDKLMEKLHLHDPHNHDQVEGEDNWQSARMRPLTAPQLDEILMCGSWGGAKPSELFLNVYAQALLALDKEPLNGLVSPSLMGSRGVVPLTIISVIPDIIHHHYDLIIRAQHEVFLATNFWEASGAAHVITDAFLELSRRVVARNGKPVVIKLMYDRGNPKQAVHAHQIVGEDTYTAKQVKLPHPSEIPGISLEVQNYHVPPVGTFHAKYMVVDRRVAILNSNNIQDRVNLEMMVHIEGPIVQSFYDMALLSWWEQMTPALPLLRHPPNYPVPGNASQYDFGDAHPLVESKGDLDRVSFMASATLGRHHAETEMREPIANKTNEDRTFDATNNAEAQRVNTMVSDNTLTQHLNTGTAIAGNDGSTQATNPFTPILLLPPHDPVPMAMVNRPPHGRPGHGDTVVPQDQAWLAGFKFAQRNVFIQTPTFNAKPVVAAALDAVRRGILVEIYADLGFNDAGELLPFQGGTNEMVAQHMYAALEPPQRDNLRIYWYTGKDQRTPLNAKEKSRNCHVKIMIVDDQIAIQGNGNQDSQSWYHSQEINILLDSPIICEAWRKAIDTNQNTKMYGRVSTSDGIWRDEAGQTLPGQKPPPNRIVRPFVGVVGAVQRVRGEGGFAT